eukprot:12553296-Ditylum_brightwellii.AAC.1
MDQFGVKHVNCHYQLRLSRFVDAKKTTMKCHPLYRGALCYDWVDVAYIQQLEMVDHIPSGLLL